MKSMNSNWRHQIFPRLTFQKVQDWVARSMVSANHWLRGIKTYRWSWYLTRVSANHASSNWAQAVWSNQYLKSYLTSKSQRAEFTPSPHPPFPLPPSFTGLDRVSEKKRCDRKASCAYYSIHVLHGITLVISFDNLAIFYFLHSLLTGYYYALKSVKHLTLVLGGERLERKLTNGSKPRRNLKY